MLVIMNGTNNKIKVVANVDEGDYEYLYFDICPVVEGEGENEKMTFEETQENHFVPKYDEANFNLGNSLLAVKSSTNAPIDWSWHLWFCEDDYRPDVNYHEYPSTKAIVMDRSLGSINRNGLGSSTLDINLTYWDDCLYYQWGRKDPMLPSGNTIASGATYDNSKQNPRTFYTDWTGTGAGWSSTKSSNDPCPPGYMVPSKSIWRTEGNTSTGLEEIVSKLGVNGYPYSVDISAALHSNIIYPFAGYLGTNGELQGTQRTTTSFENRDYNVDLSIAAAVLYYDGYDYVESGELWTNTGTFHYERSGTEVTSSEFYVKISSYWFPGDPNSNPRPAGLVVGGSTSLADQVRASATYNNLGRVAKAIVNGSLYLLKDDYVLKALNSLTTSGYDETPIEPLSTPARGIQIRCMKQQ